MHAPRVVISVLATAPCVDASCLDMTVRDGANPHVVPRGRDGKGPNPVQHIGVGYPLSSRVEIREAFAGSAPRQSRRRAIHTAESWHTATWPLRLLGRFGYLAAS